VSAAESKVSRSRRCGALFAQENGRVALDLTDVTLADRKVVRFLALCEGNGVELRCAPDYLSDWVSPRASGNG
jgi:hypothetical protein